MTRLGKDEARYVLAKKKSDDLAKSSKKTSELMSADITTMREKGMTPSQYYGNAATAAKDGSVYWQGMMDDSASSIADTQQKSKDFQAFAAKNPDIKGNVEGFQRLDAQNTRMNAQLLDMSTDFKQMLMILQSKEHATKKKESDNFMTAEKAAKLRASDAARNNEFFSSRRAAVTPDEAVAKDQYCSSYKSSLKQSNPKITDEVLEETLRVDGCGLSGKSLY